MCIKTEFLNFNKLQLIKYGIPLDFSIKNVRAAQQTPF